MSKNEDFNLKISNYMQNIFNLRVYFVFNTILFFGGCVALYYVKNIYLWLFCIYSFYNFMYIVNQTRINQQKIKEEFEQPVTENDKK